VNRCNLLKSQHDADAVPSPTFANLKDLQVADICANVFYRYFRDDPDTRAYDMLRPKVVGWDDYVIRIVTIDEPSLHRGDLSDLVSEFDLEEWKRLADEREQNVNPPPAT
jgi:hypothetical protein